MSDIAIRVENLSKLLSRITEPTSGRAEIARKFAEIVAFAETCADCPQGRVEASSASWTRR